MWFFFWKLLNWQYKRLCQVKFIISLWNEALSVKLGFPQKSKKEKKKIFFFNLKKNKLSDPKSENVHLSWVLIQLKAHSRIWDQPLFLKSFFKRRKAIILSILSYWLSSTICKNWSWASLPFLFYKNYCIDNTSA